MLSYKDNRYDSQEVFLPLLCFLELEAALTVLSMRLLPLNTAKIKVYNNVHVEILGHSHNFWSYESLNSTLFNETWLNSGAHSSKSYGVVTVFPQLWFIAPNLMGFYSIYTHRFKLQSLLYPMVQVSCP